MRSARAMMRVSLFVGLLSGLGLGCIADGNTGKVGIDGIDQDGLDGVDGGDSTVTDTGVDTTVDDTGSPQDSVDDSTVDDTTDEDIGLDSVLGDTGDDTTLGDTTLDDTTPDDTLIMDTVHDTGPSITCGDGVLDMGDPCDDGNVCANDGCDRCALETTVVLTELALAGDVGFDLDDADGDANRYTGVDNKVGQTALIRAVINPLIAGAINRGDIIELVNLDQIPDPSDAPSPVLSFFPGVDPACPRSDSPVPWVSGPPTTPVLSDAQAFAMCRPAVVISDSDDPANGIYPATFDAAQPDAPLLHVSADTVALPTGLGDLDVGRTHIEATVALAGSDADVPGVAGLVDGRLGGILSAATLFQLDTSASSSRCPTALHVMLGLAGHLDMDREDNGGLDFIQFTTAGGNVPCINATVNIVGCCNDGDCTGGLISGPTCVLDPAIGDGYSAAFSFAARRVSVVGQADAETYCTP